MMTKARERLVALEDSHMENGWLGPGSFAPSKAVFRNAVAMLGLIPDDAWAIPMDNGTIEFEWGGDVCTEGYNLLEVGQTRFAWITPTAFLNGTIQLREFSDDFDNDDVDGPASQDAGPVSEAN